MLTFYDYNWIGILSLWLMLAYPITYVIIDMPYARKITRSGELPRKRPVSESMLKSVIPSLFWYFIILYFIWVVDDVSLSYITRMLLLTLPFSLLIIGLGVKFSMKNRK